jgi:hypothetical protein
MQEWGYRNMISVTEISGIPKTNFPVLIDIQGTNPLGMHYINFSLVKPGGDDLRFTKSDGATNLIYGIEEWDDVSQTAKVWVKIDSLPASQTIYVFLYYENPAAAPVSDLASVLYG